jgi:hypothetical protein
MENGLNPAARVLEKLGGEKAVSNGTGIPIDTLWRWQRPRERDGTGGRIPQERWAVLVEYGLRIGKPLRSHELQEEALRELMAKAG